MISFNSGISTANISSNISSITHARNTVMEQVSTGDRINSARDDAAGTAQSVKLTTSVTSKEVAMRNIQEGVDYLMTVDAMLEDAVEGFQVLREKTVLGMNHDNKWNPPASHAVNLSRGFDFDDFLKELEDTMQRKGADGKEYLNPGSPLTIQVGSDASDTFTIDIGNMSLANLRSTHGNFLRNWNTADARTTTPLIDDILATLSSKRGQVGAAINSLSHQYRALSNETVNTQSALTRIKNADFAMATSQLTKIQIKEQTALAVYAQATTMNESLSLTLIQG